MMKAARFFVFDGVDGAGKSTALQACAEALRAQGHPVLTTREPGGSEPGEAIRELLLRDWQPPLSATAELLLMFAARREHLERTIHPALAAGQIVLCDRYVDSSYVYQGRLGGVSSQTIDQLLAALPAPGPSLTMIFDLPPSLSLQRLRGRGDGNRFDSADPARLESIREAFLQRANQDAGRYRRIDAQATPAQVLAQILETLQPWI